MPDIYSGISQDVVNICANFSGHKYNDLACDGQAGDNPPLSGVDIKLLNAQGTPVAETTTDLNGVYSFDNVLAGSYSICEDLSALPGSTQSYPTSEIAQTGTHSPYGVCYERTLVAGNNESNLDFYNCPPPVVTPTPCDTNTPVPPTATNTNTPVPPTPTSTNTPVPSTPTSTNTPVPPTPTNATNTPVPPTATNTSAPTATATEEHHRATHTPTEESRQPPLCHRRRRRGVRSHRPKARGSRQRVPGRSQPLVSPQVKAAPWYGWQSLALSRRWPEPCCCSVGYAWLSRTAGEGIAAARHLADGFSCGESP